MVTQSATGDFGKFGLCRKRYFSAASVIIRAPGIFAIMEMRLIFRADSHIWNGRLACANRIFYRPGNCNYVPDPNEMCNARWGDRSDVYIGY